MHKRISHFSYQICGLRIIISMLIKAHYLTIAAKIEVVADYDVYSCYVLVDISDDEHYLSRVIYLSSPKLYLSPTYPATPFSIHPLLTFSSSVLVSDQLFSCALCSLLSLLPSYLLYH